MSRRGTNGTHMRPEDRRIIDTSRTWFVLQADPMAETKAEEALEKLGVDVWVPRFYAITIRRRRKVEDLMEFFPRYLFAGLERSADTNLLFRCDHVAAVLGVGKPLPIAGEVLQVVADRLTGNVRSERLAAAAAFRVGEMRPVIQGPFSTFMAEITELLASGKIMADVEIFGRPTPVEFDPKWLGAA